MKNIISIITIAAAILSTTAVSANDFSLIRLVAVGASPEQVCIWTRNGGEPLEGSCNFRKEVKLGDEICLGTQVPECKIVSQMGGTIEF